MSAKGRSFRDEAVMAITKQGLCGKEFSERLSVKVTLFPPDRRKRDIDNFQKAPFDALTHAKFWKDDEQVDKLLIVRGDTIKGGKIVIYVWKNQEEEQC